ncbi:hypothetical protein [Methyloversatilis sp.]|uniref:DUF7736 domain-containing protein n=1 Tax=Methyloversatilis sp. TaxID=2569862 RepID=UPI0035B49720
MTTLRIGFQRMRNLTTGKLHTQMQDIYEDIDAITGVPGVMTHMLPHACSALQPYLKKYATDPRFYDGSYDPSHVGEVMIPVMSAEEKDAFFKRFGDMVEFGVMS